MFRNMIKKIGSATTQTLFRRNTYKMYNEVPRFDASKDYYQILQITKDSTDSQVKKAYYRLAKSYHPDSNPGKQGKFKQINEAYSVLSDQSLRRQYNSARSFQGFSRRMGRKASQGTYQYEQYRSEYENFTPEQQQQILSQAKQKLKKGIYFALAMILILPFITRKNHRYYIFDNGQLVPVQFQGGFQGGMIPPPVNPYGPPPPYSGPQDGVAANYPPHNPRAPYHPNQAPFYQSPYNQQQRPAYNDPYQSVVQNIHHQPPPPPSNYRQQTNLQPGYTGPIAPS